MDLVKEQFLNFQLKSALRRVGYSNTTVGEIGEDSIYTNEKIKQTFIESISDQDTFKPIMGDIIRLIETDRIVPVHVEIGLVKRVILFFSKNKRKFAQSNFAMAFFDNDSRKIFVLVENITNFNYWMKQESLSLVLLHELQHMTSTLFPNSFMNIHGKYITRYFKYFINLYFGVSVSDDNAHKLASWLHHKTETTKGRATLTSLTSKEYFQILWSMLDPHFESKDKLKKAVIDYFNVISVYMQQPELYSHLVHNKDSKMFYMFKCLRESYRSLNILKTDSLCIQEVLYPGEIICIESEFNTQPRHFQLITKIK